jgi:CBS domain containing-hemolysin-like protein
LGVLPALVAVAVASAQGQLGGEMPAPAQTPPFSSLMLAALASGCLGAVFCASQTALMGVERIGSEREEPAPGEVLAATGRERLCRLAALLCLVSTACLSTAAGWSLLPHVPTMGSFLGASAGLAIYVVLADVVARHIALMHSRLVVAWVVPAAVLIAAPLRPLSALVARLSVSSSYMRAHQSDVHPDVTHRELRLLPHVQGVDRVVEEEAVDMIDSVREFTESTAGDIMTPRIEVEGVEERTPAREVVERLRATPYSRLLVYRETLDDIAGLLLAKDVLLGDRSDPLKHLRQPIFVPAETRLPDLLRQLRDAKSHLAVVVDEYGGTSGIVTLHDLFEQIVGDHIEDAEEDDEFWIEMQGEDRAQLSGRVELWEVNSELGLDLDESVSRTLGGFLMTHFGRVPEDGDVCNVEGGRFTVKDVQNNRIARVEFERLQEAPAAPAALPATGTEEPE